MITDFLLASFVQTLYVSAIHKNGFKARIAAEYAGVNLNLAPNFEGGVTNKSPEFLKMNPLGKVCWNLCCYLVRIREPLIYLPSFLLPYVDSFRSL